MAPIGNHHRGIVMLRLIGSVTGLVLLMVARGNGIVDHGTLRTYGDAAGRRHGAHCGWH
jgi:hypothetical protein